MRDIICYRGVPQSVLRQEYLTASVVKESGKFSSSAVYAGNQLNYDAVVYKGSLIYDPNSVVDMPFTGRGSENANSQGWLRDKNYYSKALYQQCPEAFSPVNIENMKQGRSLVVDNQMSAVFPQYKEFEGQRLVHHHIGGDGQAVGIPESLHIGYGGVHNAEEEAGIRANAENYSEFYANAMEVNPNLSREEINRMYSESRGLAAGTGDIGSTGAYDRAQDVLIPVTYNKASAESYIPRGDEYAFSGRVDANPQYGNGGATQYYLPYANEMKEDGRLVPVERQVEDVTARTGSGEPRLVKEYTDENGVHTILDYRPMDPDELKELEEGIPESAEEAEKRAYDPDDLSEEDLAVEDMPGEDFYRNYDDEYKHPLTNQENSGGSYSPDGWKEPVNLEPGQRFYQVSTDGETKSCYFTDQETVDSCRREDGSVNFESLREKLQIGNGDDKITLTAYEFRPEQEKENIPNRPAEDPEKDEKNVLSQNETVKDPGKTDEDTLTPKGDEEDQTKAANTGNADEDTLSQNGDEEDQTKGVNEGNTDEDALSQNSDEEDQANAANAGNADEDTLSQNGDEEDQANAANTGNADEDTLSQNGDEEDQANAANAGNDDEDALSQNGDEENQANAANTGNADEDTLSQNGDEEDQANAANAGNADEDTLAQNGGEEEQANAGKSDEDGLTPKGDEEDQTKAANTGNADEDTLSQNGDEEDQSNAAMAENSGDEADTLSQNNKKEEPSKAENAGKADDEDDLLAQNSSDEEQSNAADGVKSEDGTISQNGDENEKSSGQEDEDVLAQNSGDQDEQKAAAQPGQTQGGTEQNNTDSSADQKDSGNSKDNGMGME